jgi:hypothetical protein
VRPVSADSGQLISDSEERKVKSKSTAKTTAPHNDRKTTSGNLTQQNDLKATGNTEWRNDSGKSKSKKIIRHPPSAIPSIKEELWKNQQGKTGETVFLDGSKKDKKQRKFPFRKISDIEEEIFARETQIMTLNDDLLRPEIARDGERTKTIHLEIKEEQEKIARLYEHWEEASEKNW